MSLTPIYHGVASFNNIVGCPILVNSADGVACTESSSGLVFSAAGADVLALSPYNFSSRDPLLLKLFFTGVVLTGTLAYPNPEFIVTVSGAVGFTLHRIDSINFSLSLGLKNWSARSLDTTVSIYPIPPLTGVSLNCLAGLATDVQDTGHVVSSPSDRTWVTPWIH
jgi:hypothetical protein